MTAWLKRFDWSPDVPEQETMKFKCNEVQVDRKEQYLLSRFIAGL